MKRAHLLILLALAAAFALLPALWTVWKNERILSEGKIVLLKLAPVAPRSLMQGDYMALSFAIDRALTDEAPYVWLTLDPQGRADFLQQTDITEPPRAKPDMLVLRLRKAKGSFAIAPNGFFFQEGAGDRFTAAEWGEFRVAPNGKALLTHLRDDKLERLGENLR
ncbi:MAG: GDYXXLXY domain-containing protein [Zoogloeaceae bacterium]|jgi:uncharacterized membrane-anchored protein|nr:GDYXXLXY domain-containing protein [Zoogloeaceae bacterium]